MVSALDVATARLRLTLVDFVLDVLHAARVDVDVDVDDDARPSGIDGSSATRRFVTSTTKVMDWEII